MTRRTYWPFLVAATCVVVLAGCGGSGKSTGSSSASAVASRSTASVSSTTTSAAAAKTSSSRSSSTTPTGGSAGAAVAGYCQQELAAVKSHLSSNEVAQLAGYCSALSKDNAAQLKAAEKMLCAAVIKDTVPAAERAAASSECAKL